MEGWGIGVLQPGGKGSRHVDGRGVGVLGWGARDISRASGKRGGIVGGALGRVRIRRVRTHSWRFLNMRAWVHKGDPTGQ